MSGLAAKLATFAVGTWEELKERDVKDKWLWLIAGEYVAGYATVVITTPPRSKLSTLGMVVLADSVVRVVNGGFRSNKALSYGVDYPDFNYAITVQPGIIGTIRGAYESIRQKKE